MTINDRPFTGRASALAAMLCVGGCGSMPKVSIEYFHATATAEVVVTQTAICTAGNKAVMASGVSVTPSYSSDRSSKGSTLQLDTLGGGMTRADASFVFYEDGRLKGINATQTGQGADTLKSIVSLGVAGGPFMMYSEDDETAACELLRGMVGPGKALTIVSRATTDYSGPTLAFDQMSVSRQSYQDLYPIFGEVLGRSDWVQVEPLKKGTAKNSQAVELKEPAAGTITVLVKRGDQQTTFTGGVLIPQKGKEYSLPIQKGPWFGENIFELALAESGQITKLRYAGESGTNSVLGVIGNAGDAAADSTLSEDVARAQLEADLIYQQQRLILCQTDPANCPK